MRFSNANRGTGSLKLIMGFSIVILLFISVGGIAINGLVSLGTFTKTIHQHPLVVSNAALRAALNITKMHRSMKDVVLSTTRSERLAALNLVATYESLVYDQLHTIEGRILGEEGKQLERETRALFDAWKPIRAEVAALMESGQTQEAVTITQDKGARHVAALEGEMLKLTRYARNKANGFLADASQSQAKIQNTTIALTAIGVIASLMIAIYTAQQAYSANRALQEKAEKLRLALDEIKSLQGIIPICSYCNHIRDNQGIWKRIEQYFHEHSDARFSHGVCPECAKKHFPNLPRNRAQASEASGD